MLKSKLIMDKKHDDILKHLPELIDENGDPDINHTEKKEKDVDLEVKVEEDFDIKDEAEEGFEIGGVIFIDDSEDIEKV